MWGRGNGGTGGGALRLRTASLEARFAEGRGKKIPEDRGRTTEDSQRSKEHGENDY